MIRLGTVFWLVLVSATGLAMFGVKYQVQALEDELARNRRATMAEEHEIRVLEAEWAYLTRPETLDTMNRRFMSLAPISTKQLHTAVADIPMRPSPPMIPAPIETVVAAAGPTASPSVPPSSEEAPPQAPLAPIPAKAAEPPSTRSALQAMPAWLQRPVASPQLARAVAVKTVARPSPSRRAKSLDDLIAQIMASQ